MLSVCDAPPLLMALVFVLCVGGVEFEFNLTELNNSSPFIFNDTDPSATSGPHHQYRHPCIYFILLINQYTAPSDAGVVWPTTKRGGRVSTTAVAKKIWCAAAGEGELESSIAKESNWRWNYPTHLVRLAEESAKSPSAALEIASRGLDAIHSSLQYIHPDGSRVALSSISERDAKPTVNKHHQCQPPSIPCHPQAWLLPLWLDFVLLFHHNAYSTIFFNHGMV